MINFSWNFMPGSMHLKCISHTLKIIYIVFPKNVISEIGLDLMITNLKKKFLN